MSAFYVTPQEAKGNGDTLAIRDTTGHVFTIQPRGEHRPCLAGCNALPPGYTVLPGTPRSRV